MMSNERTPLGPGPRYHAERNDARLQMYASNIRDPYTLATRKARRNSLLMSIAGIAIVHVGLVPKNIQALGITISASNQSDFLMLVGLVTAFLTITFVLYAFSENAGFQIQITEGETVNTRALFAIPTLAGPTKHAWLASNIAEFRLAFEFWAPTLIGIYSSCALFVSASAA